MSDQVGSLTITHTAAGGTLIAGTTKGDGTNTVLKAAGWRWSRNLGAWYVPQSRDTAAPAALIDGTVQQLRAAGFSVDVAIDEAVRSTAEVESDRIARQAERVDRLTTKAVRAATAAQTAREVAHELADRVPFGQPILAGHHSQGRMTRHYAKIDTAHHKAAELADAADAAAEKANAASHTTGARYAPITVANRIERIEAGIRFTTRALDGAISDRYRETLTNRTNQLNEELAYWKKVRADQIAAGQVVDYGPDTVRPGHHVRIAGQWYEVIRANRKTVTVPSGYSWTNTTPYRSITGHRAGPAPANDGPADPAREH